MVCGTTLSIIIEQIIVRRGTVQSPLHVVTFEGSSLVAWTNPWKGQIPEHSCRSTGLAPHQLWDTTPHSFLSTAWTVGNCTCSVCKLPVLCPLTSSFPFDSEHEHLPAPPPKEFFHCPCKPTSLGDISKWEKHSCTHSNSQTYSRECSW